MRIAWCDYFVVLALMLGFQRLSAQEPLVLDIPDRQTLLAEDQRLGLSARFASPIPTTIRPTSQDNWISTAKGMNRWQLNIQAPGAAGLFLALDQLQLPKGAKLSLKTVTGELLEELSAEHLAGKTKYLFAAEASNDIILEYEVPIALSNRGGFHLFKIFHVYKYAQQHIDKGTEAILSCHVNSACAEASTSANYGQGTVRILRYFDQGLAWCSGAMINTTRMDQTPYVLTAFHCVDGLTPDYELWRFDFNHATLDCAGEVVDGNRQSVMGAQFRAGHQASDFLLLELLDKIPAHFQPYFMGWNVRTEMPKSTTTFHHPNGRRKMVSVDHTAPYVETSSISWSNHVSTPAGHHLVVQFDEGTQETGSSGGPLLNERGQLIGQLHGGNANCQQNKAYFGWLAKSWQTGATKQERLDQWLAPDNQDVLEMPGFAAGEPLFAISGKVRDQYGQGMSAIVVNLFSENKETQVTTDLLGNYFFNKLSSTALYSVRPSLTNNQAGEIIIKIKNGKRMATFTAMQHELHPGSKQSTITQNSYDLIFEKVYPNQIDIEAIQYNLQALDFTVIKK